MEKLLKSVIRIQCNSFEVILKDVYLPTATSTVYRGEIDPL